MLSTSSFVRIASRTLSELIKEDERFAKLDIASIEKALFKSMEGKRSFIDDERVIHLWMDSRLRELADEGDEVNESLCLSVFSEFIAPIATSTNTFNKTPSKKRDLTFWLSDFLKGKPSAREVIEAVFDSVFTKEELDSMLLKEERESGREDVGIKYSLLHYADEIIPRYSIEESIRRAKEMVDPFRDQLPEARTQLFQNLAIHLFYY